MLIVPLAQKPTWSNMPVATFLLLAINVFVFIFLQLPDAKVNAAFQDAYLNARLAPMEFPRYAQWLDEKNERRFSGALRAVDDEENVARLALRMQMDREFISQMEKRQRKALDAEAFAKWRAARAPVDAIWRRNFTEHYLFVPAQMAPVTFITHMFMHGGFAHLLGNMVMLVLVGMLVEQAVGVWPTLLFYLLGGLGSVLFELPFHGGAWIGSLGASGAIAALMGASSVIYGLRKVRFFYHLVFYFDFVMLPAIVVLPVWLVNEVWQWALLRHVSNVAYFAHVGGLIAGAGLAFLFKRRSRAEVEMNLPPAEDAPEDPQVSRERRARQYLAQMNWDAALREFRVLAEADPKNIGYAEQVYKLSRMQPATEAFHRAALALLSLAGKQPEQGALLARTLVDYWGLAKPGPRLTIASMVKLCKVLAKQGYGEAAELPATLLAKLPAANWGEINPAELWLTMAAAFHRAWKTSGAGGDLTRARHYVGLLEERHPASDELKLARQLMA